MCLSCKIFPDVCVLVRIALLVYWGKQTMHWEEGRYAELSPRVEQGADPDMRGRASLSQKQTLHLLRKEGRHSLWIQVKGELVAWEGKDDQGDI